MLGKGPAGELANGVDKHDVASGKVASGLGMDPIGSGNGPERPGISMPIRREMERIGAEMVFSAPDVQADDGKGIGSVRNGAERSRPSDPTALGMASNATDIIDANAAERIKSRSRRRPERAGYGHR